MLFYYRLTLFCLVSLVLSGCNMLGDDNLPPPSPLPKYTMQAQLKQLWSASVGSDESQHLRFALAAGQTTVFAAGSEGSVVAVNRQTGSRLWQRDLNANLTAGVGTGEGIVVVGSAKGEVFALATSDGKTIWKTNIANQALSTPTIANGLVILKTIDDQVIALDARTGQKRWDYTDSAPEMVLRLGSTPVVAGNKILVGLASGKLIALNQAGNVLWQHTVAMPQGAAEVERMVDVDTAPLVQGQTVYAASYQGNIAALRLSNGDLIWQHKLSAYTGIAADRNHVFITNTKGEVLAFFKRSGTVDWKQAKLAHRWLTAPVSMGNNLLVADGEGYLHALAKRTGQFITRVQVDDTAIVASPLVVNNTIYVLSTGGTLAAYHIQTLIR